MMVPTTDIHQWERSPSWGLPLKYAWKDDLLVARKQDRANYLQKTPKPTVKNGLG